MTLLRYDPGAADPVPYHDESRHIKYFPGSHEVPSEAAEEYLAHRAWERDPDAYGAHFDAETFRDQHWQSIVDAVERGDVDDRLEEIRAAEQNREAGSGPRPSVLSAVDSRLSVLTDGEE